MLKAISRFFDTHIANEDDDLDHRLRVATAALMFELIRMDDRITDSEENAYARVLCEKFTLSEAEVTELRQLAAEESHQANDYYQFTSLINKHFDQARKILVVEYLWQLAAADKHIDPHEEYLIRKLADLLHLTHAEYIQAKLRALDAG